MMTVMALALTTLGLIVYIKADYPAQSSVLDILQVLAVTTVMFGYGAGPAPLIWVYLAELLPREYKVLSGLICALGLVPVFLATKIFPTLLQLLTPAGTYWLFAAVGIS